MGSNKKNRQLVTTHRQWNQRMNQKEMPKMETVAQKKRIQLIMLKNVVMMRERMLERTEVMN